MPPGVRADLHGVLSLPGHQEGQAEQTTHRKDHPERERSPTVPQRIANLCPVRHLAGLSENRTKKGQSFHPALFQRMSLLQRVRHPLLFPVAEEV